MTTSLLLAAKNKSASEYENVEDKCPMVQFVELIAGKWAIPILYRLIVTAAPFVLASYSGQLRRLRKRANASITRIRATWLSDSKSLCTSPASG